MAEMITGVPLFRGRDNNDQLNQILRIVGTPDDATLKRIAAESVSPFRFAYCVCPVDACLRAHFQPEIQLRAFPRLAKMPFAQIFAKAHPLAIDLLEKLLRFDPAQRLSCDEALKHPYFGSAAPSSTSATLSPQQQYMQQQQQMAMQQAAQAQAQAQQQTVMQ